MTTDNSNIISLVTGKKPSKDKRILKKSYGKGNRICLHGPYLIDEQLSTVECEGCGEKLNPMFVLMRLAGKETTWHTYEQRYNEDMARLQERSRTKCEHCKEMTRISK